MTATTAQRAEAFEQSVDTGASATDWSETFLILSDADMMEQITIGGAQADGGELLSFEDVFGERP